jgi:Ca-activated chloride channel family protein
MLRRLILAGSMLPFALHAQEQVQTLHVNVRLVQVACTAFDRKTHTLAPITSPDQIRLFEDGKPQPILALRQADDLPLTLGILLDTSTSETGEWDRMRRQTQRFLAAALHPGDRIFLIAFDSRVRVMHGLTGPNDDPVRIVDSLDILRPEYGVEVERRSQVRGGTRLWDAMDFALHVLDPLQGRKALVLFTDGDDNASIVDPDTITHAAQNDGVTFFGVDVEGALAARALAGNHTPVPTTPFAAMVATTGGQLFNANGDAAVTARLSEVARLLRTQFVVEYRPPQETHTGFHRIRVEPVDKSIEIRARAGVYR